MLIDQTDILTIIKNINEDIINNIVIKGIPNITDIILSESNEYKIDDPKNNEKTTLFSRSFFPIFMRQIR